MSRCPYTIELSAADRDCLIKLSKHRTSPAQIVDRSRILLQKEKGVTDQEIAKGLNISVATVRFCIHKYLEGGIDSALYDKQRKGRPAEITSDAIAWMLDISCRNPSDFGYLQESWELKDIHKYIQEHAEEAGYPRLKTITKARVQQLLKETDSKFFKTKNYSAQKIYTEDDYYNLPKDVQAELIWGELYYQAALGKVHQDVLSFLHIEIANYIRTAGIDARIYSAPFAVKLFKDRKNIVLPDISIVRDKNKLTNKGCTGAPDWIIQIVSDNNSYHNYVRKLCLYMEAGVHEYWIVNPSEKTVYVYYQEKKCFKTCAYSFQDKVNARIFSGLWIDFSTLEPK